MWFEKLMGFSEESPEQVRGNISVDGEVIKSHVNGKSYISGILETPTLGELRERVRSAGIPAGDISIREVVADVQDLHGDPSNSGALFQVASQFNLLEMVSPTVTPEQGVGKYEYDQTQGPACAVAAGAGTIYRNYFAKINGKTGQSADNQIDCLADIGAALGNDNDRLWAMSNGYALATESGLVEITERLEKSNEEETDKLRQLLRIGLQWNTEVTLTNTGHTVSQAYCSALPVAYSGHSPKLWQRFAQLVLEASYEATICAAILNYAKTGNNKLFLTFVGGGVFGNEIDWILNAIKRALDRYKHVGLDVITVSYGSSNHRVQKLVRGNAKYDAFF